MVKPDTVELAVHLFHAGFALNEEQNLLVLTDIRARRGQKKGAWIRCVKRTRKVTCVKDGAIRTCIEELSKALRRKNGRVTGRQFSGPGTPPVTEIPSRFIFFMRAK